MRILLLGAGLAFLLTNPAFLRAENSLQKIKREGVLRWGADPSGGEPFVFNDPKDPERVIGFEVDLMDKLAERLGVRHQLEKGQWEFLIDNLKGHRIDLVLNGMEVTRDRAREIRFTVPYFVYVQQLTVRKDQENRRTLADLKGSKVAILGGSAANQVLKDAGWTDGLIVSFDDSLKPYEALRDKRVDAVLAESIIAARYAPRIEGLVNQPDLFGQGNYAGAVRQGPDDADLVAAINNALEDMKADGALAEIYQHWKIDSARQGQLAIVPAPADKRPPPVVPTQPAPEDHTESPAAEEGSWGPITISLLWATGNTLLLTAVSMPLALFFGLLLALMGMSRQFWVRWPAQVYIQVMRGTPLLVQIYIIYSVLPQLGVALGTTWLTWEPLPIGILCLSANYAAYEAEIHRAGLEAVPKGRREAGRSLGMTEFSMFRFIVLPQSFRIILPPVVNDLVSMLKDSCMVSTISVAELLYVASTTGKATFHYARFVMIAAVIYFLLSFAADRLGKLLEKRLRVAALPDWL